MIKQLRSMAIAEEIPATTSESGGNNRLKVVTVSLYINIVIWNK